MKRVKMSLRRMQQAILWISIIILFYLIFSIIYLKKIICDTFKKYKYLLKFSRFWLVFFILANYCCKYAINFK